MFPWEIPFGGRVVVHAILTWMTKATIAKASADVPLNTAITFSVCSIAALAGTILFGEFSIAAFSLIVFLTGAINGYAAYACFIATRYSQSGVAFFAFVDDIVAIGLSFIILSEHRLLGMVGWSGLVLCITATILFAWNNKKKHEVGSLTALPFTFFVYGIGAFFIWGIAHFMMRVWGSIDNVSIGQFVVPWYLGACTTAYIILGIRYINNKLGSESFDTKLPVRTILTIVIFGILTVVNLVLTFATFSLAPLAIVKPAFSLAQIYVPLILGLFVFNEKHLMGRNDWAAAALAIVGTTLLLL